MSKLFSMAEAIAQFVPDGTSVAMSLQLEQMIPFAAAHEIIRQKKRNLTLIGPISDVLFDQLIGAGCVDRVIAAWIGNAMMGSAYISLWRLLCRRAHWECRFSLPDQLKEVIRPKEIIFSIRYFHPSSRRNHCGQCEP